MVLLTQILVAIALLGWGGILALIGLGISGLSRSQINFAPGNLKAFPAILGLCIAGDGIALLAVALGWSPPGASAGTFILGALFLIGMQLALGHARFEDNLSITMLRHPKTDRGLISRFVGAVSAVAALVLLVASSNLFGWRLFPGLIVGVIDVCTTFFAAVLINVLTGTVDPRRPARRTIITLAGVIAFVAILIRINPDWGIQTAVASEPVKTIPTETTSPLESGVVEIVPSKRVVQAGETATLTVSVDPAISAPTFRWSADYGSVPGEWVATPSISYSAPSFSTLDTVRVTVRDAKGQEVATGEIKLQVVKP